MKEEVLLIELWPDRLNGIIDVVEKAGMSYRIARPHASECLERGFYGGIIISGGAPNITETDKYPFLADTISFVGDAVDRGTPILGICLGHQVLAASIGGKISRASVPEMGFVKVYHNAESLLYSIKNPLVAFEYHIDEVASLPRGTEIIATNDGSRIQAFKVEGRPCFGVQFHPEVGTEKGLEILSVRKEDICANGHDFDSLIRLGRESYRENEAAKVLVNYMNLLSSFNKERVKI
jgi:GMP synthase-like glutamine amidotransferase